MGTFKETKIRILNNNELAYISGGMVDDKKENKSTPCKEKCLLGLGVSGFLLFANVIGIAFFSYFAPISKPIAVIGGLALSIIVPGTTVACLV